VLSFTQWEGPVQVHRESRGGCLYIIRPVHVLNEINSKIEAVPLRPSTFLISETTQRIWMNLASGLYKLNSFNFASCRSNLTRANMKLRSNFHKFSRNL
jgi:hypothetical protein